MKPSLVAALGAGLALPADAVWLRCRHDMNAARAQLAGVGRHVVSTEWGAVEYAERGQGEPSSSRTGSFTTASADSFPSAISSMIVG